LDKALTAGSVFADPDGNPLLLHHGYAPRVAEG
jgi:hypothetical protein